jgi:hypothetical protein
MVTVKSSLVKFRLDEYTFLSNWRYMNLLF